MILYHGTSTEYLPRILHEDLLPREQSGQKSHWEGDVESKPEFVYLSDAYPVYFALHAARIGFEPVVIRVEVIEQNLYPDEDFIAYHLAQQTGADWKQTIASVNPHDYQPYWSESLLRNGNVCTPAVKKEDLLDYREIPLQGNENLLLNIGGDSMPNELNYSIQGEYYRKCVRALFEVELTELSQVIDALYESMQRADLGDEAFEQMQAMMKKLRSKNT